MNALDYLVTPILNSTSPNALVVPNQDKKHVLVAQMTIARTDRAAKFVRNFLPGLEEVIKQNGKTIQAAVVAYCAQKLLLPPPAALFHPVPA